jgi:L-glutamine-phosphate cytidylyltransferase
MRAIILAAGRGSRMGSLTDDQPKCRTELHGKSLIDWQILSLQQAGITELAIVRGYLADSFDFEVKYFENERWAETNMVMSLVMADEWLQEDTCIISYSDIVFSSQSVNTLCDAEGDIVITYDPNWYDLWSMRFEDPLSDAETFQMDGDKVIEIGNKANSIDEIKGQFMGLLKFSPQGWKQVLEFLDVHTQDQRDKLDMTKLLQGLIKDNKILNATPIKDPWYEVDSEADLEKYSALPALF